MKYLIAMLICLIVGCTYNHTYEADNTEIETMNERANGWAASGNLVHKQPLTEVSLQVNFPESRNYTAQFKLSGDLRNKKTVAEITWTVNGNPVRRLVTVADGVSVQGAAQAVSVKIKDVSTQALGVGVDPQYLAIVTVVPGTRGSTSNPPTLDDQDLTDIATTSSEPFEVPQAAGIVAVGVVVYNASGNAIPDQEIQVVQVDAAGNAISAYDPRQFFWVPLAAGCTLLIIRNRSATDVLTVKPIWGIDG